MDTDNYKLPQVVRVEPASICNLKCVHCPTGVLKDNGRGIMSPEMFSLVLNEVKAIKPVAVVLYHGGEPFLNKDIFNMIRQLKALATPIVRTVTNGMLLDRPMLIKAIESGLDKIEFSLDGTSPEENNEIRIGSDYHKVSATIKELIELKREFGSKKPSIYIGNGQFATKLGIRKTPRVAQYLIKDFEGQSIRFFPYYAICWPGFPINDSKYTLSEPFQKSLDYCNRVMRYVTIRHNGDVVPCCYDITGTHVLGNIKNESISKIWNNERYGDLRESIKRKEYLPLCQNCILVNPGRFLMRNQ